MSVYAAKSGTTIIDEAAYNDLLDLYSFEIVYTGSSVAAKTGTGVAEFDCASYDHCGSFAATGVTEISRLEFNMAQDGAGADLTLEIRSGMNPAAGTDGTLLKSVVIPGEWIPATAGIVSIPCVLTGLTAGNTYWWRIRKAGDATNHFHLVGETSQDGSYPAYYRAAASGNWTLENSIQFTVYSGLTGDELAIVTDQVIEVFVYTGADITGIRRFVPPIDGTAGGIRDTLTFTWSGTTLQRGVVS